MSARLLLEETEATNRGRAFVGALPLDRSDPDHEPRTLIFGTSYLQGGAAVEMFRMWEKLVRKLNPETDVLVIDSASPETLPVERWEPGFDLIALPDNIGHLSRGGRDGWGRAFTAGLAAAIAGGYDWAVAIETDLLFARPVSDVIARLVAHDIKCAAPMAIPYSFAETALSFWNVAWVKRINLIGQYDWAHPTVMFPEQRIDRICAAEMFALPLRGCRYNDLAQFRSAVVLFNDGIDWITHADLPVLREFMRMNGHE